MPTPVPVVEWSPTTQPLDPSPVWVDLGAYVEIGPADRDYEKFAAGALTQEEMDERAERWREGDEPLKRQFLDFLARGEQ